MPTKLRDLMNPGSGKGPENRVSLRDSDLSLSLHRTRPLQKVPSVNTQAVLTLIIETNEERKRRIEALSSKPLSRTPYSRDVMRKQFVAGLLARTQTLTDTQSRNEFRRWVNARLLADDPTIKSDEDRRAFARSAFGIRGVVEIVDGHDEVNPPTINNVPVVGVQWGRVGRQQYADFEKRTVFELSGDDYVASSLNARLGAFPEPSDTSQDRADVLLDVRLEYEENGVPKVAFRREFSPSLVSSLRGTTNQAPKFPANLLSDVPANNARALVTAHPAARFSGVSQRGAIIEFDQPIDWIVPGNDGAWSRYSGRVVVLEKWDEKQSPDELKSLPRVFGEIREEDIQEDGLHRIHIQYPPGERASDWASGGIVRFALADEKILFSRGYGVNRTLASNPPPVIDVLEAGQEDKICYVARYLAPGTRTADATPITLPNQGDAGLVIFNVQSSIAPPMPKFSDTQPDQWNILFTWDTTRTEGGVAAPVYDASNHFEFQFQREQVDPTETAGRALRRKRDLDEIFRSLINGDNDAWNSVTQEEQEAIALWFAGARPEELDGSKSNEQGAWLTGSLKNVVEGSAWLAPEPADFGDTRPVIDVYESNMERERREDYRWRFRARAIENPEREGFQIYSDWTTLSDWLTPLPLKPRFVKDIGAVPVMEPREAIPAIKFKLTYDLVNRREAGDLENIEYRLVVRKDVPSISGASGYRGFAKETITDRIVVLQTEKVGPYYVGSCEFKDVNVAPPDALPPNSGYVYEFELNQLNKTRAIQKSDIWRITEDAAGMKIVPDRVYEIKAEEPRKLSREDLKLIKMSKAAANPTYSLELEGWQKLKGNVFMHANSVATIPVITKVVEEHANELKLQLEDFPPFSAAVVVGARIGESPSSGLQVVRTANDDHIELYLC